MRGAKIPVNLNAAYRKTGQYGPGLAGCCVLRTTAEGHKELKFEMKEVETFYYRLVYLELNSPRSPPECGPLKCGPYCPVDGAIWTDQILTL